MSARLARALARLDNRTLPLTLYVLNRAMGDHARREYICDLAIGDPIRIDYNQGETVLSVNGREVARRMGPFDAEAGEDGKLYLVPHNMAPTPMELESHEH